MVVIINAVFSIILFDLVFFFFYIYAILTLSCLISIFTD